MIRKILPLEKINMSIDRGANYAIVGRIGIWKIYITETYEWHDDSK